MTIETINVLSEALGLLYAQCKPDLDEMAYEKVGVINV